jgi:VWFA-related protein
MPIRWFLPSALLTFLALALPLPTAPQQMAEQVVMHAATHVVMVNVVVKDKHGKPVDDLHRDDFVLRDNGQEQKIAMFALEQTGGADSASVSSPARLTFTNRPGTGSTAVTVFLFDQLNTRLTDQQLAKSDFLRYLRDLPATERVAVFVLGDSLSLLHDFSQDMASLLAAINRHTNRVSPEAAASQAAGVSSHSLTGDSTTTTQWDGFLKSSNQPYTDYAETVRATRTAAALETIAGHLQGIPGRKTLIWISGGFPIQLGLHSSADSIPQSNPGGRQSGGLGGRNQPGSGQGAGATGGAKSGAKAGGNGQSDSAASNSSAAELPGTGLSFESDVARAIRALNEADVAVYPVDARGVMVAAAFQADRGSYGKRNKPPKSGSPPDFNYETLETLAGETGGRAFHHINDLSAAIREAAGDARVSYSLAFYPSADNLDNSYHRLEVSVQRPGVKARYRPGYVATKDAAVAPSLAEAIANPIALAAIGFTAHLDPVEGGYRLSVTIDPRNITLEPKDGKWNGSLQFLVVVGKVEQLTTIPLTFTEAMFHQIQDKGLVLGARVKTPPGTNGFSVGFRDMPSGLVGTLHVPL